MDQHLFVFVTGAISAAVGAAIPVGVAYGVIKTTLQHHAKAIEKNEAAVARLHERIDSIPQLVADLTQRTRPTAN